MIQHISILSIFSFKRISKGPHQRPNSEMNRPPKWCSQPDDWHFAQSRSNFVTLGEN